ncbi:MAG: hypothetical protein QOJ68_3620, partial [Blastococcus sp.]|nr:hypothetical protein [Blastococcus sp.]
SRTPSSGKAFVGPLLAPGGALVFDFVDESEGGDAR